MYLLRRPISASDRIPDKFYVISMEFLSLSRRRPSARNVPSAKSEEKRMFSQARNVVVLRENNRNVALGVVGANSRNLVVEEKENSKKIFWW